MSATADGGAGGRLAGRLVALGVTGSIAAYKSVELLRALQAEGADVVVVLTESAKRFVAPLALEALSRRPVDGDVLALMPDGRIGHIVIADTADAIVVAPATAHWLAAMATGLAGDVVTATCLATAAPVVVAPAMDGEMFDHPATRENVARLRDEFGYAIVGPERGPLASGQSGVGRLAELPAIVDAVVRAIGDRPVRVPDEALRPPRLSAGEGPREADLAGRRIVVTAGGTLEPIDPVRFIGNRSSGRMGVAIAEAALDRGAEVTLIAANVSVPLPAGRAGATVVRVESTAELRAALRRSLTDAAGAPALDALVMAAAVADFTPARASGSKIARGEPLTLELEPTPDLLAEVAGIVRGRDAAGEATRRAFDPAPVLVGFAAETGSLDAAGPKLAEKVRRKGVDLLVANDVAEPGSGFGTETNRVTLLAPDAPPEPWPLQSKRAVADALLDRIAARLDARDRAGHTGRG